jgi:hypothetical protein
MKIEPGVIAMVTEPTNYGRLVHVDRRFSATHWAVTSLQTVTLAHTSDSTPAGDFPAGTRFIAPDRVLIPFGGLDATEEASNALPNVMAPRRQVEFAR